MENPKNTPQSPENKRAIVYVLRERLKELSAVDRNEPKARRQAIRKEIICKIALTLSMGKIPPKDILKLLPTIAQKLDKILDPKDLAACNDIARHLPHIKNDPTAN